MLSQSQKDHYEDTGAIVVPGVLDEFTRKRMKTVLANLVESSRKVETHDDVYDLEPGHSAPAQQGHHHGADHSHGGRCRQVNAHREAR